MKPQLDRYFRMSKLTERFWRWRGFLNSKSLAVPVFFCLLISCVLILITYDEKKDSALDLITSRAVLEDPEGVLTIENIVQVPLASWRPQKKLLLGGYSDSAHWVRITLSAIQDSSTQPVFLRIRPAYIDEIQLYEPIAGELNEWRVRFTGDKHSFDSSQRTNTALGFFIYPVNGFEVYYLRIKTTSSSLTYLEAQTLPYALHLDARLNLLQICTLAVLGAVCLWAVMSWLQRRERLVAWFVAYQISNIVFLIFHTGLGASLTANASEGWADKINSYATIFTVLMAAGFHREVFRNYRAKQWMLTFMDSLRVLAVLFLGLYLVGYEHQALQYNAIMALLLATVYVLFSFRLKMQPQLMPSLRLLRFLYFLLLVVISMSISPIVGWSSIGGEFTILLTLLYGVIAAILMMYMLSLHNHLQRKHANQQAHSLAIAQAQLGIERKHVEDQRQFIDMLTHEIKTPLGVASLCAGALQADSPYLARIRRALDNINSVVDRAGLSYLSDHQGLQPKPNLCDIMSVITDCIRDSHNPSRIRTYENQLITIKTDPQLLAIIINNLLDNALKYSHPGKEIRVRLLNDQFGVTVIVSNHIGDLEAPDKDLVFTKFYRNRYARGLSGSGLGLYLSNNIAGLLGGRLEYHSVNDVVEFSLWIPI